MALISRGLLRYRESQSTDSADLRCRQYSTQQQIFLLAGESFVCVWIESMSRVKREASIGAHIQNSKMIIPSLLNMGTNRRKCCPIIWDI